MSSDVSSLPTSLSDTARAKEIWIPGVELKDRKAVAKLLTVASDVVRYSGNPRRDSYTIECDSTSGIDTTLGDSVSALSASSHHASAPALLPRRLLHWTTDEPRLIGTNKSTRHLGRGGCVLYHRSARYGRPDHHGGYKTIHTLGNTELLEHFLSVSGRPKPLHCIRLQDSQGRTAPYRVGPPEEYITGSCHLRLYTVKGLAPDADTLLSFDDASADSSGSSRAVRGQGIRLSDCDWAHISCRSLGFGARGQIRELPRSSSKRVCVRLRRRGPIGYLMWGTYGFQCTSMSRTITVLLYCTVCCDE